MLIKHFPAFPSLWKLFQKKPGKGFFPLASQVPFLSHGTGGLTRLSATLGTNCPWFTQNYLGSYDSHLFHNNSQGWGQRCLSQIPALLQQLGDLAQTSKVSRRSRNHGALPLPHPCLGFGNGELQVEKWSVFQGCFGKAGFVERMMGLELSQEYSCVMRGGANQVFQRNLLWSGWKNQKIYEFWGYCRGLYMLLKPLPTWPRTLAGMKQLQLVWASRFATLRGKEIFPIYNLNPPCGHAKPFPLSLSLHAFSKTPLQLSLNPLHLGNSKDIIPRAATVGESPAGSQRAIID